MHCFSLLDKKNNRTHIKPIHLSPLRYRSQFISFVIYSHMGVICIGSHQPYPIAWHDPYYFIKVSPPMFIISVLPQWPHTGDMTGLPPAINLYCIQWPEDMQGCGLLGNWFSGVPVFRSLSSWIDTKIQSSAVITRSNFSRYYIRHCDNSGGMWIRF